MLLKLNLVFSVEKGLRDLKKVGRFPSKVEACMDNNKTRKLKQ